MEWELRIILGVIGAAIIGYAVFDRIRRRKNKSLVDHDSIDIDQSDRDREGFDFDGVGKVRVIKNQSEAKSAASDETLSAIRENYEPLDNNDTIRTESITDSDNELVTDDQDPELIFALSLIADDDNHYAGDALLQTLIEKGCRYGEMNIFHRFRSAQSKAKLFSVANAFKPGTFDIDDMTKQSFRGVSFFIGIPGPSDPEVAYKTMVETARAIQNVLGGKLLDAHRSVFTDQRYQHDLEQINDYKRKNLTRHKP